jgi:hypothetical protein
MLVLVTAVVLSQTPAASPLAQFEDACFKPFPDLAAARAFAKKSGWKQRKTADAAALASGNWSEDFEISPQRTLKLHSDSNRGSCSIVFGEEAIETKAFIASVEKELEVKRDQKAEAAWNKVGLSGTGNSALVWRGGKPKGTIVSSLVKDKEGKAYELFIGHPFFVGAQAE